MNALLPEQSIPDDIIAGLYIASSVSFALFAGVEFERRHLVGAALDAGFSIAYAVGAVFFARGRR